MARNLADSLIIPFNLSDYAVTLEEMKKTLLKSYGDLMQQNGIITCKWYGPSSSFSLINLIFKRQPFQLQFS